MSPQATESKAHHVPATPLRILGIETSCDETAIGIVTNGRDVLSNAVASSLTLHAPYGGVIPEIAARVHVETIWEVLHQALKEAHSSLADIDAVAVTQGPGLPGALLVGLAFAKGLALALNRPLVPVDHLAAHLYAGEMTDPTLEPPYIGLVVSGGHTLLCVVHADCRYELLGETRDDAVGEAFDKVAKLLGLGYPGGPVIDRLSDEARTNAIPFPRTNTKQPFDFSFSGLKTAVYQYVQKTARGSGLDVQDIARPPNLQSSTPRRGPQPPSTSLGTGWPGVLARDVAPDASGGRPESFDKLRISSRQIPSAVEGRGEAESRDDDVEPRACQGGSTSRSSGLSPQEVADIAASFQEAAIEVLVKKTLRACQRIGTNRVVVGGGVASNRRLRARFAEVGTMNKWVLVFPPPWLCVDNGAMVAGLAYPLLRQGRVASLSVTSDPNLCLVDPHS